MADTATVPARPAPAAAPAPALDETMLAMDVVDTLRHADRLVERELEGDARRAALEQHRFTYTPTPPSFRRSLATLWATRARWGRAAGIALLALLLVGGGWW